MARGSSYIFRGGMRGGGPAVGRGAGRGRNATFSAPYDPAAMLPLSAPTTFPAGPDAATPVAAAPVAAARQGRPPGSRFGDSSRTVTSPTRHAEGDLLVQRFGATQIHLHERGPAGFDVDARVNAPEVRAGTGMPVGDCLISPSPSDAVARLVGLDRVFPISRLRQPRGDGSNGRRARDVPDVIEGPAFPPHVFGSVALEPVLRVAVAAGSSAAAAPALPSIHATGFYVSGGGATVQITAVAGPVPCFVIGTQRTHVTVQVQSIAATSSAAFDMDLSTCVPHELDSRTRTLKESDHTRRMRPAVAAAHAFRLTCAKYKVDVEILHSLLATGGWTLTADVIPVAPGPAPPLRDCAISADDKRTPVMLAAIAMRAGFPGDAAAPLHVAASATLTRSMLAAAQFPCVAVVGGPMAVETPVLAAEGANALHPSFTALVAEAAARCASSAPDLKVVSSAASPVVPPPASAALDAQGVLTTPPTAATQVWWLVEVPVDGTVCAVWRQDAAAGQLDAWRQEAVDRRKFPAGTEALLAYLRRRAQAAFGRDVAAPTAPPLSPTTPTSETAAQDDAATPPSLAPALLALVASAVRATSRAAAAAWLARQATVPVDDDGDAAALARRLSCASDALMTVGPPGCGKSTLMRAFATALKVASQAPSGGDAAGTRVAPSLSAEWLNQDECGKREFFLAAVRQAGASRTVSHVIIDKSNLTDQSRDDYRDLLHVTAVILFAHPAGPEALCRTCVDRISRRGEHHRTLRASGGMDKNASIVRNFVASYRGLEDLEGDASVLVLDVSQPVGLLLRRLWKHLHAVGSVALPPLSDATIALAVQQSNDYEASLR